MTQPHDGARSPRADFRVSDPQYLADPYPYYHRLRSESPLCWVDGVRPEDGGWWLTRYEEITIAGKNWERFGRGPGRAPTGPSPAMPEAVRELFYFGALQMLNLEPPDHSRLRGLVSKAFTPRMVAQLRPTVESVTTGLIDRMVEQGEADLIHDLAYPLPVMVIAALLGFPIADSDRLRDLSRTAAKLFDASRTQADLVNAARAMAELVQMMREIMARRRAEPRDDLISGLIQASEEEHRATEDEIVANAVLLLLAGHETTTNLIGNGLYALLQNPDQWSLLRSESDLIENAVEELLRFDSPVQGAVRMVLQEAEIAGMTFKAGERVWLMYGAANRDPAIFPDPDRLDLRRPNASRHLSFGQGIHFCLGAPLARLEGQIAIREMVRRAPDLTLRAAERSGFATLRGFKRLDVTL